MEIGTNPRQISDLPHITDLYLMADLFLIIDLILMTELSRLVIKREARPGLCIMRP